MCVFCGHSEKNGHVSLPALISSRPWDTGLWIAVDVTIHTGFTTLSTFASVIQQIHYMAKWRDVKQAAFSKALQATKENGLLLGGSGHKVDAVLFFTRGYHCCKGHSQSTNLLSQNSGVITQWHLIFCFGKCFVRKVFWLRRLLFLQVYKSVCWIMEYSNAMAWGLANKDGTGL